jgi:threonine dehydratase
LLHGSFIAESRTKADALAANEGLTYINGFDDPEIIAGQGTMGLEILQQVPELDAILVPVGGGGLVAGIALAIKSLKPSVQVIGVEPERAASFAAAMKAGQPVMIELQPTLADGLSVPMAGPNAFAVASGFIDRMITVGEAEIARAILRLAELEKSVVEGAAAVPLAACLDGLVPELRGRTIVLPLCGGNIDMSTLGRVIERGLASDGRLFRFTTVISDRPGGLARFAEVIAEEGASFLDISHDRAFADEDISTVSVQCVVETRDPAHIESLRVRCAAEGFHLH